MQKYDNDMIVNTLYDMYLSIEDYDINPEIIKKRQKALKRVIAMYATPDEFNYLFPSKQMKKIMENLWSDLTDEVCPERLQVSHQRPLLFRAGPPVRLGFSKHQSVE